MKYIIEIENEPFGRNDDPFFPHGMDELYRAKGFKSLVFDLNGLDKLTPYTEPDREAIENEVWEFAWEVLQLDLPVFREIFGYDTDKMDYREYKSKYEAWKKQRDEIHVGDEVIIKSDGVKGVVLDEDLCGEFSVFTENGCCEAYRKIHFEKTGRHLDFVERLLEEMREES